MPSAKQFSTTHKKPLGRLMFTKINQAIPWNCARALLQIRVTLIGLVMFPQPPTRHSRRRWLASLGRKHRKGFGTHFVVQD